MNDTESSDRLQQLEARHTRLLDELDTLNQRLEQTLNSFSKSSASHVESDSPAGDVKC